VFFSNQNPDKQSEYERLLQGAGALSELFSDNDIPFLHYRMAENMFCKAFEASSWARSDIALDAKKDDIGLGIKTLIETQ
jgi:hypothetical protein